MKHGRRISNRDVKHEFGLTGDRLSVSDVVGPHLQFGHCHKRYFLDDLCLLLGNEVLFAFEFVRHSFGASTTHFKKDIII